MLIARVPEGISIAPFTVEVHGSVPASDEARWEFLNCVEEAGNLLQINPDARYRIFTGKVRLPVKRV